MATKNRQSALDRAETIAKRAVGVVTPAETGHSHVTPEAAIEATRNDRRRDALLELAAHHDDQLALAKLASMLAEDEYGPEPTATERKRIYVSLFQTHIPRLETLDLVYIHDDSDTTVVTTDRLDAVAAWWHDTADRFGGDA